MTQNPPGLSSVPVQVRPPALNKNKGLLIIKQSEGPFVFLFIVILGKGHMTPEKEELYRLRKENIRLRMEHEILKKAAAFFAKESM